MSAMVMWHNLCCEWEADDEIRKRLREKGAHGLLLGKKDQQTNKVCSDNACVLAPVLARMAGTHGTPIPHIEPFRVEVQSLMEQTQSTFDEVVVDDIAWQLRKLASHVKMKVRRQEVSHETKPQWFQVAFQHVSCDDQFPIRCTAVYPNLCYFSINFSWQTEPAA